MCSPPHKTSQHFSKITKSQLCHETVCFSSTVRLSESLSASSLSSPRASSDILSFYVSFESLQEPLLTTAWSTQALLSFHVSFASSKSHGYHRVAVGAWISSCRGRCLLVTFKLKRGQRRAPSMSGG